MIKVAVTGNIGSGKSTVVKIFTILDIPVFHADYEAKLLYKEEHVKTLVHQYFGDAVFNEKNDIDFKLLAQKVFSDPASLQTINHIIHPFVFERYHKWLLQTAANKYTIHEAAVLFENKLEHHFDLIINVSAPENVRLQRVIKRDGIKAEQFYARAEKQLPDKVKNKKSDFVIYNDGNQLLIPQVMEIHKRIMHS